MMIRHFNWLLAVFLLGTAAANAGDEAASNASGFKQRAVDAEMTKTDPADAILGIWATDKAEAHIEISRTEDDTYTATIIWLKEPFYPLDDKGEMGGQPKVDRENPDPELRDRPIVGLQIMQGLRHAGRQRWVDGEIYDPETGKTYSSKIWLTDEGTLKVRGYVGISLFGRTTEWTPVLGAGDAGSGGKSDTSSDGDGDGG